MYCVGFKQLIGHFAGAKKGKGQIETWTSQLEESTSKEAGSVKSLIQQLYMFL